MATPSKPALPWSTAARIAWRELRASRAKFVFVLLSVAIGVAALTGVRGFSEAFQRALLGDARGIMAADLSARMFRLATPKEQQQLDALATSGVETHQRDGNRLHGVRSGRPGAAPHLAQGRRSRRLSLLRTHRFSTRPEN